MSAPVQLTPGERGAYGHFFALADPQSTGVVSGNSAVSFFALSGLPSAVLGTIWTLADRDNNGFLTPAHFSIALRLIGHAQSGKVVTEDLASQPGPLPAFKGVNLPAHLSVAAAGSVSTPSRSSSTLLQSAQLTGGGVGTPTPPSATEIRPEDRARYTRIFAGAGPQAGLLDGEKAKEIFVKSKLPFDKLGAIWNLADTKARGRLDLTDFIVGMHFIQSTMNGTLNSIPATLPAGLYEKAANPGLTMGAMPGSPLRSQPTGGSIGGGGGNFIARQMTGQSGIIPGSPTPSSAIRSPSMLQPQRTGLFGVGAAASSAWAVSSVDKAKADQFFDGLDQDNKGILEGQAAVPFFMQSGLNEATLAHVWDLSDITQSGTLTKDEFAVAMYLINLKLTGSDLPQELPANLIPPSLRGQTLPQAVNPQESDTQRDLFSLMDDDVDMPITATSAFAKPAFAVNQAARSVASPPPAGTARGAFDSAFDDDFTSSGPVPAAASTASVLSPASRIATLSPTPTGASSGTATGVRAAQPFGDAGIDEANQRNALESTQKSLTNLEQTKSELSRTVASDATSIEDLKTRLETVRMRHQTESEAVKALQQRQAAQATELRTLREESVREESELSRLRAEKDEIEQSLMKDREDVRAMKRQVGELTKQKEAIKVEIEKMKKDARQQKGLLAIGKKQLTQSESDVTAAKEELADVTARAGEHGGTDEVNEHAAHGEVAVASPPTATLAAAVQSPAASVRSNNPFDRVQSKDLTPSSPHATSNAALAVGGAAGVLAGGVGAAALHHEVAKGGGGADEFDEQADPFGVGTRGTEAGVASNAADAFDDDFGKLAVGDAPAPGATDAFAVAPSNVNPSFDDAFADLDQPGEGANDVATYEPSADIAQANEAVTKTPANEGVDRSPVAAPTVDEAVSSADTYPGFTAQEKGKAVEGAPTAAADDDSSDEDDGPEDVEGAGRRLTGSPDEIGEGKPPFDDEGGVAAEPVTERFPVIDDESITSKAPITAPVAVEPIAVAAGSPAVRQTGSGDSEGAIDAFHDANDSANAFEDSTTTSATNTPFHAARSSANELPLDGHERFATANESNVIDAVGGGAFAATTAAAAAKTRRAPPAVPSRAGTTNVGAAIPPAAFNAGPFAGAAPSAASAEPAHAMDDFDAAFEDLGAEAPGAGTDAGNVTAASGISGFDDTFGEADGFDFVPSFGKPNSESTKEGGVSSNAVAGGNTFDGFDSAFDDAFAGGNSANRAAQQQPVPATVNAAEDGFSFEDAFVPAEAISTGLTPPQNSTALPFATAAPAAPARPSAADQNKALPDDAGPVKQLCSMGFSRPDVIKALERSNYRTDKALERLLASA